MRVSHNFFCLNVVSMTYVDIISLCILLFLLIMMYTFYVKIKFFIFMLHFSIVNMLLALLILCICIVFLNKFPCSFTHSPKLIEKNDLHRSIWILTNSILDVIKSHWITTHNCTQLIRNTWRPWLIIISYRNT